MTINPELEVNRRTAGGHDCEVDLSLIELNLSLSVEERLRRHDEALELVEELRRAGERIQDAETCGPPSAPAR